MTDWQRRARALADTLAASGALTDPRWHAAVEHVPRHEFVPRFWSQGSDYRWHAHTVDTPGWWDTVYSDAPLTTELGNTTRGQVALSSSSQPGLMVRMLEMLDPRPCQRVLEIGTGTGWNAGLLCHALGDGQVWSIDIGVAMIDTARNRLGDLGYRPTLVAGDGAAGMPGHRSFDRIIATCSVPAVPPAWRNQLADGGLLLVDVQPSAHAGNLVLLRRDGDTLSGRFSPKWAGFMAIRTTENAADPPESPPTAVSGQTRQTTLDPYPWSAMVPWFLAQALIRQPVSFGLAEIGPNGPAATRVSTPDGSVAEVATTDHGNGTRDVRQAGPTRLWDAYETAHTDWNRLGRPDWDRLGLTINANGTHTVWVDNPNSEHCWHLADASPAQHA